MPQINQITPAQLSRLIGTPEAPVVLDVRLAEDVAALPRVIPTSRRVAQEAVSAAGLGGLRVTRARTTDRIACPRLIRRFIDRDARVVFVAPGEVERTVDADRHDLSLQSAGMFAISVGLSRQYRADVAQREAGRPIYDPLYRRARDRFVEGHDWPAGRPA
jgi:hypothetical protein